MMLSEFLLAGAAGLTGLASQLLVLLEILGASHAALTLNLLFLGFIHGW